ncbi:hypothetical protein [Pontibacter populi]|uniref:NlpE C-terminal OB domain-containing protein n=1 Tax=Pontibacter populi TaxID=890055 RepID=A0ABV1RVQ1_9BACT
MKKLYFLLLSAGLFVSCDKENVSPDITYPSTYKTIRFYNTTPVIMYTSGGQVKDQARVNAFADRYSDWYFLENKEQAPSSEQYLKLLSAEEAESSSNGTTNSLDVHKEGDLFVFTSKTEGTVTVTTGSAHFRDVQFAVSKYKPVITEWQQLAPATGYAYTYKTKNRFYAHLKNKELQLPRMFITLKSTNGSTITSATSNVFDAAGLTELNAGDTLIVQSFINAAVKQ